MVNEPMIKQALVYFYWAYGMTLLLIICCIVWTIQISSGSSNFLNTRCWIFKHNFTFLDAFTKQCLSKSKIYSSGNCKKNTFYVVHWRRIMECCAERMTTLDKAPLLTHLPHLAPRSRDHLFLRLPELTSTGETLSWRWQVEEISLREMSSNHRMCRHPDTLALPLYYQ